jgi:hypothetical protein
MYMVDESLESQVNQEYASNESEYNPRQPQNPSTLSKLGDAFSEMYQNVKDLGSAVRDSSDDYSARRRGAVAGGLATAVGAGLLALGGCDGGPGTDPGNGPDTTHNKSDSISYTATLKVQSSFRDIPLEGVPIKYQVGSNSPQRDTTDSLGTITTSGKALRGSKIVYNGGGEALSDVGKPFERTRELEEGENSYNATTPEFDTKLSGIFRFFSPEQDSQVKSYVTIEDEFVRPPVEIGGEPDEFVDTETGEKVQMLGTHYTGTKAYHVRAVPVKNDSLNYIPFDSTFAVKELKKGLAIGSDTPFELLHTYKKSD